MTKKQIIDFVTESYKGGVPIKAGKYFMWTIDTSPGYKYKSYHINVYHKQEQIAFVYYVNQSRNKSLKSASYQLRCGISPTCTKNLELLR